MRKRISKYKHLHSNRFRYWCSSIPLVCASGLLLVTGMMISPIGVSEKTFAGELPGLATAPGDDDSTATPSIVMGIADSDTTLLGQVSDTSTPGSITRNMTITAANVDKYAVYVQANDSNNGQLVGQASGGRVGQIASTDGVALNSIPDNTWGYAIAEGENLTADNASLKYKAVTSAIDATNPAYSTTAPSGTKKFTLAFGVKFADSASSDHYKANVLVSVAVNPGEVASGFGGIQYMHELDALTCYRAKEGATAQLLDARDESQYWITKMQDGNCWMTQNLDYNPITATQQWSPSNWNGTSTANNYAEYYDPGKWVYKNQLLWDADSTFACPSSNTKNGLNGCIDYGWLNVSDWTASDDPNMTDVIDESEHIYNAHYLVGNYYSFQAATKKTGKDFTSDGQNVTESICPQGWELPKKTGRNSFQNLNIPYYEAVKSPYYLVVGGGVGNGAILNAGYMLYYWTSTVKNVNNAYVHGQGGGNPSDTYRFLGNFVRCMKLGIDGL